MCTHAHTPTAHLSPSRICDLRLFGRSLAPERTRTTAQPIRVRRPAARISITDIAFTDPPPLRQHMHTYKLRGFQTYDAPIRASSSPRRRAPSRRRAWLYPPLRAAPPSWSLSPLHIRAAALAPASALVRREPTRGILPVLARAERPRACAPLVVRCRHLAARTARARRGPRAGRVCARGEARRAVRGLLVVVPPQAAAAAVVLPARARRTRDCCARPCAASASAAAAPPARTRCCAGGAAPRGPCRGPAHGPAHPNPVRAGRGTAPDTRRARCMSRARAAGAHAPGAPPHAAVAADERAAKVAGVQSAARSSDLRAAPRRRRTRRGAGAGGALS